MPAFNVSLLTQELIGRPSPTGEELPVLQYVEDLFKSRGWKAERLYLPDKQRFNLLTSFGCPKIIFTTHLDTVPAEALLLKARKDGGKIYGRGACDAKGAAACMICAASEIAARGGSDFGLLFVVGEETDGIGALSAATALKGRGVKYLINGEPTSGTTPSAQRGCVDFSITFSGQACHSGYPQFGFDANRALLECCSELLSCDFGFEQALGGKACINLGLISGGVATNVVSPKATLCACLRTVKPNSEAKEQLALVAEKYRAALKFSFDCPPAALLPIPGFQADAVSFCSDLPNFSSLEAVSVLYGPGSIHQAHGSAEYVEEAELYQAVADYQKIFSYLQSLLPN
jgi:acetylornithine deacetylase